MADITVSVSSSEKECEKEGSGVCLIELSVFGLSWKVERNVESFQELYENLKISGLISPSLGLGSEMNTSSLDQFLRTVLVDNGEKIWFCPFLMQFIDVQKSSELKNLQVAKLMKQYSEISNERSDTASKLQDAWKIIATLAQRMKVLETSQQRINNSFKPKEDGVIAVFEAPLLAGAYRFDEIMNQAAEVLKDETDWVFGEDGGFVSVASMEVIPVVIPDPPPVVHTYHTSEFLPMRLIPTNEEPDERDKVINSILCLLEPQESQISYRNSARAFLARVVRRSLGSKIYEIGLHSLNCFLPDDPIRLTILLGRTNLFVDTWLPTLTEKLSTLTDPKGESGSAQILELMQSSEEDFVAGEDQHPLNEHTVSHVNGMSRSGQPSQLFCAFEQMNVEVVSNSLSDLRFLAFLEEVAQLVGKNELFKRSLLLIRGWWTYETASYINNPTKNFLSDAVLSVLVCSIFNQYHTTLFQPLQVLSVFLAEYCELDWRNYAVTIQGVVPFRTVSEKSHELTIELDAESTSASARLDIPLPGLEGEPWLRYPIESDLLNVAILQKHTDFLKPTAFSNTSSRVIPVPGGGFGYHEKLSPLNKSPVPSPMVSPVTAYRELDESTLQPLRTSILSDGNSDIDGISLSLTDADESVSDSHSGIQGVPAKDAFLRRTMNILHPLNQSNMILPSMTSETAISVSKIFEVGAKNLSTTLKAIQEEQCNTELNFNRFFKCVLSRFSNGWRPDVFRNAQSMCLYPSGMGSKWEENASKGDKDSGSAVVGGGLSKGQKNMSQSPAETIWDQVCYMGLVLTGCVSESAVLALSKEILFDRGTLPVGEIGKVLQELTCASSFLGKLKEKFGGLKKFLERFPDEFMICTDHPFNPHVFIKKALTEEELESVAKGNVPSHLTAKYKKAQRNKKAKPMLTGSQSPSMMYHSLHPQQGTGVGQGYNGSLAQGANAGGFRGFNGSMPSQGTRVVGTPRAMGMSGAGGGGGGGTPVANAGFPHQQLQQQNNQYYVQQQQMQQHKLHQGQNSAYPASSAPLISSRSRASNSQSILRASASASSGFNNGSFMNNHGFMSTSPQRSFQGNYSGESSHTASGAGGGAYSGGSLGGGNYPPKKHSLTGGGLGLDRNSNSIGSERERDSMFGLGGTQAQSQSQGPRGGEGGGGLSRSHSGAKTGGTGATHPNSHRAGESHLGKSLFSNLSPSPSSSHSGFESQFSYDSCDQRSFPSHTPLNSGQPNSSLFRRSGVDSPQLSPAQQYGDLLRSGQGQRDSEPTKETTSPQNFDPFQWI